ncbi:hypothetical protein FJY69_00645 [candidate division WOR-3 bacterium]|nr:hypothetical protein [candidate division WOR-3 bacterium]
MAGNGASPVTPRGRTAAVLVGVLRFLGLWVGLSGTIAAAGQVCPCCGRPACPVGIGSAAILGALGSFVVLKGRALLARLRRKPDG